MNLTTFLIRDLFFTGVMFYTRDCDTTEGF